MSKERGIITNSSNCLEMNYQIKYKIFMVFQEVAGDLKLALV